MEETKAGFPVIDLQQTGIRIKQLRIESGLSVSQLNSYLGGISKQSISKWERGKAIPCIDNLLALSLLYNISINDMLVYELTKG